jgi:hypothetical protein
MKRLLTPAGHITIQIFVCAVTYCLRHHVKPIKFLIQRLKNCLPGGTAIEGEGYHLHGPESVEFYFHALFTPFWRGA